MEEKKNNKGLIIGLIIFLIICLILVFYFMFKMVYKEPSNNNSSETSNTETNSNEENNSVVFTELAKYTLLEGEEKEIIVEGKKIKIKRKDNKCYLNDMEIEKIKNIYEYEIYVIENLIVFPYFGGQSGDKYQIYNQDVEKIKINDKGGPDAQYNNIRLKNNRIFVDIGSFGDCYDACPFSESLDTLCLNEKYKDIKEYPEKLDEHKNEVISKTYEIKYNGNEITIEKAEDINTIEKWIETYDKVCLREE